METYLFTVLWVIIGPGSLLYGTLPYPHAFFYKLVEPGREMVPDRALQTSRGREECAKFACVSY